MSHTLQVLGYYYICCWNSFGRFERLYCLHLQGELVQGIILILFVPKVEFITPQFTQRHKLMLQHTPVSWNTFVSSIKYREIWTCHLEENMWNSETSVDNHWSINWPRCFLFLLCRSVLRGMFWKKSPSLQRVEHGHHIDYAKHGLLMNI